MMKCGSLIKNLEMLSPKNNNKEEKEPVEGAKKKKKW